MNRILPEQVKAAYEKTGLTPTKGGYGDGVECGCPAVALSVAACGPEREIWEVWAENEYGAEYIAGFMGGVDSVHYVCERNQAKPDYQQGYADGLAVAAAIWG